MENLQIIFSFLIPFPITTLKLLPSSSPPKTQSHQPSPSNPKLLLLLNSAPPSFTIPKFILSSKPPPRHNYFIQGRGSWNSNVMDVKKRNRQQGSGNTVGHKQ